MFRPFRSLTLIALAFLAGVIWEQNRAGDACAAAGGMREDGLCRGVPR